MWILRLRKGHRLTMAVNGIATGNYPTNYYAQQVKKNNTSGSFTQQMENAAGVQKREHKVYMKTDDMLFSGGYGSGLSFYIKYAEGSTDEDPTVVAKGVDENGNEFEQTIHINDINPRSATLVQMHALEAYLGVPKGNDISSLPKGLGNMGLHDKADFMALFQKTIRDMRTLGERKLADYYSRSMQAYEDFMTNKGKSGSAGSGAEQNAEPVKANKQESTSNSEVITRPDGSRVLLITTQVGGMQMVTSIALSQPSPLMDGLKSAEAAQPALLAEDLKIVDDTAK